jgi:hypothetical protein
MLLMMLQSQPGKQISEFPSGAALTIRRPPFIECVH